MISTGATGAIKWGPSGRAKALGATGSQGALFVCRSTAYKFFGWHKTWPTANGEWQMANKPTDRPHRGLLMFFFQ